MRPLWGRRCVPRASLVATVLALLAFTSLSSDAGELTEASTEVNPVTRVLNMLLGMSERVTDHVKQEDVAFEKFMCYCKKTGGGLEKEVVEAQEKLPQLTSSVEEAQSSAQQLVNDLKEHGASRDAASKAIAEQDEIRKSEAAAYAKESTEMKANIAALQQAITALKGTGKTLSGTSASTASLLETGVMESVRNLVQAVNPDRLRTTDREQLASLLETLEQAASGQGSEEGSSEAAQDSSEILGMLEQMLENMQEDLKQMTSQEESRRAQAEALKQAKQKEIATLSATIEDKETRLANTKVQVVQQKNDMTSTSSSLESNTKLLSNLNEECSKRKQEHESIKNAFTEELQAISEASKILRSDEASDLFKTKQSGVSLLQLGSSTKSGDAVEEAANSLKQLSKKNAGSRLSVLASQAAATAHLEKRGRHRHGAQPSGFSKIRGLINQMLGLLAKEQQDDDLKKKMCDTEITREEGNAKNLADSIESRTADIGELQGQADAARKEVDALKKGIEELDKNVAEATAQRQKAHAQFVKLLADNHAALDILRMAKSRLQQFYGSSLLQRQHQQQQRQQPQQQVQPPAEVGALAQISDTSSDEFGFFSSGDAADREGSSASTAGSQEAKPTAVGKESGTVIEMITMIEDDVQKETAEAKTQEAEEQAEYQKFMDSAAGKRGTDSKALSVSVATLASVSENLLMNEKKRKSLRGELDSTNNVIVDLHKECDGLLSQYDGRKEKRVAEVEGLRRTEAVLAGATLAQVRQHKATA